MEMGARNMFGKDEVWRISPSLQVLEDDEEKIISDYLPDCRWLSVYSDSDTAHAELSVHWGEGTGPVDSQST